MKHFFIGAAYGLLILLLVVLTMPPLIKFTEWYWRFWL